MSPGLWQILLVVALVVLLFGGRGKISSVMGDFAKGIKSFRKGLSDEEEEKRLSGEREDPIDVTPKTAEKQDEKAAS